jgi:hypothetical protein
MPRQLPIHVADAVRFLAAFSPAALDELRRANPDPSAQAALQADGAVLGGIGGDAVLDAGIATAEAFLRDIGIASSAAIRATRRKLNITQYVELAGKLLALGSATALIALLLRSSDLIGRRGEAVALAVLSFLSAAIPLIVAFMRGSIADPSGLQSQYAALRDASFEAELLRGQLAAAKQAEPRDPAALAALVDAANSLAKTVFGILTDLGHDPQGG